jgi:hypothetical protein
MSGPFKMKGSPMQRNFGISPLKQGDWTKTKGTNIYRNTETGEEKVFQHGPPRGHIRKLQSMKDIQNKPTKMSTITVQSIPVDKPSGPTKEYEYHHIHNPQGYKLKGKEYKKEYGTA